MNKEKFMMELKGYLSILENQEQEDILAEYVQHIDMKMHKGLSEEEAICDFGPVEELAAQILEAYHVKPAFREERRGVRFIKPKAGMTGGNVQAGTGHGEVMESPWRRLCNSTRRLAVDTVDRIGRGMRWICQKCSSLLKWMAKPFTGNRKQEDESVQEEIGTDRGMRKMGKVTGNILHKTGHAIAVMWKWCVQACLYGLRMMWNAAWLMCSLFCALIALIMLMGIGAMIILIADGYPLVGIFIICTGGFLCAGALACGAFVMMIRKKKDEKTDEAAEANGEVGYEQTA